MEHSSISVNSDLIFQMDKEEVNVLDVATQRSFTLNQDYFARLKQWFDEPVSAWNDIDQELFGAGLLVKDKAGTKNNSHWEGDTLSRFVHKSTRVLAQNFPQVSEKDFYQEFLEFSKEYLPPSEQGIKEEKLIPLPEIEEKELSALEEVGLLESFRLRMTCRDFDGSSIPLQKLATLLKVNFGQFHGSNWEDLDRNNFFSYGRRKISPSATGSQMFDAFLYVNNVETLSPGVYFYNEQKHGLSLVAENANPEKLVYLCMDQYWIKDLSCGIFLVGDLRKCWAKDPSARAYLLSYAEAGHISQNLQLLANSLGINTWITGCFRDDELCNALKIDESLQIPAFFVGFGQGKRTAIPKKLLGTG